ncbi:hypothetical protein ACMG5I_03805 [Escherichia coli]|uniref:hypothetical protein n=1 Tax=Escherichia coli TaxID=562 RepID=UPI002377B14C|nr:hypothetical protein vBEcoMphAPEC6_02170 [Escherichia phage ph0011]
MNIEQIIRNHSFFAPETGRVIENVKIEELMVNVKYKEPNDEISSTFCALRAPFRNEKAKKPAYVLAIALGCVVKLAVDENIINIKVAPTNDEENIDLNFDGNLDEDVFFQQSLVYDFRTVTYSHINFVNEMVDIVAKYEESL